MINLHHHLPRSETNLATVYEAVEGAVEDDKEVGEGDQDVHFHRPHLFRVTCYISNFFFI